MKTKITMAGVVGVIVLILFFYVGRVDALNKQAESERFLRQLAEDKMIELQSDTTRLYRKMAGLISDSVRQSVNESIIRDMRNRESELVQTIRLLQQAPDIEASGDTIVLHTDTTAWPRTLVFALEDSIDGTLIKGRIGVLVEKEIALSQMRWNITIRPRKIETRIYIAESSREGVRSLDVYSETEGETTLVESFALPREDARNRWMPFLGAEVGVLPEPVLTTTAGMKRYWDMPWRLPRIDLRIEGGVQHPTLTKEYEPVARIALSLAF